MTTLDLIMTWFETNKMEKLSVHSSLTESEDAVQGTVRYNHTKLIDAGNSTHYPEWLFYEIAHITEYEVFYMVEKTKYTLNIHDPEFFEKFKIAIKSQIEHIEHNTFEGKIAMRMMLVWPSPPIDSGASDSVWSDSL